MGRLRPGSVASSKKNKTMKTKNLSVAIALGLCAVGAQAQIKLSSGNQEYWYNLLSAKSGVRNLAISENAEAGAAFPIAVVDQNVNDPSQQWKFVAAEGGNYYIVNRKSGKQILPSSLAQGALNATQLGTDEAGNGFKVEEIEGGQYMIYGTEEDGVVRYLALQELSSEGVVLNKKALVNSPFAWSLVIVDGAGISSITAGEAVITVKDRQIVVDNAKNYSVTNMAGVEMPKKAILEQGVYVVTVDGIAKNVYVE